MDTNNLTRMAYTTLLLADKACDPLCSEIGASAGEFATEDDFLHGTASFLEEIVSDPEDYLDSWNLLDQVDRVVFLEKIRRVQDHIALTLKTPLAERGDPSF